jgi:hypothetical protein
LLGKGHPALRARKFKIEKRKAPLEMLVFDRIDKSPLETEIPPRLPVLPHLAFGAHALRPAATAKQASHF